MKKRFLALMVLMLSAVMLAGCAEEYDAPESAKSSSIINLFSALDTIGLDLYALHLNLDRSGYMVYEGNEPLDNKRDSIISTVDALVKNRMSESDYQNGKRAVYLRDDSMIETANYTDGTPRFTVHLYFTDVNHLSMSSTSGTLSVQTLEAYLKSNTDAEINSSFKSFADDSPASVLKYPNESPKPLPSPKDGETQNPNLTQEPSGHQKIMVLSIKGLTDHIPIYIEGADILSYRANGVAVEKGKDFIRFSDGEAWLVYAAPETVNWPMWLAIGLGAAFVLVLAGRLTYNAVRRRRAAK